jgi:hypothetical protein
MGGNAQELAAVAEKQLADAGHGPSCRKKTSNLSHFQLQQPWRLQRLRRQLLAGRAELPLFNTSAWVEHLEKLLERLLEAGG